MYDQTLDQGYLSRGIAYAPKWTSEKAVRTHPVKLFCEFAWETRVGKAGVPMSEVPLYRGSREQDTPVSLDQGHLGRGMARAPQWTSEKAVWKHPPAIKEVYSIYKYFTRSKNIFRAVKVFYSPQQHFSRTLVWDSSGAG